MKRKLSQNLMHLVSGYLHIPVHVHVIYARTRVCVNSVSANLIASANLVYALRRHILKLIIPKRTVSKDENSIMKIFVTLEPSSSWKFETLLKFGGFSNILFAIKGPFFLAVLWQLVARGVYRVQKILVNSDFWKLIRYSWESRGFFQEKMRNVLIFQVDGNYYSIVFLIFINHTISRSKVAIYN